MKRTTKLIGLALLVLVALAACAPGPNTMVGEPDEDGDVAGFWMGLWHGIIAPVTFFISLFTDKVNLYDVFNNGGWYDFGFVLGAGIIFGGGGGGAASSRRRR
mgnify:CR=1 FL=1